MRNEGNEVYARYHEKFVKNTIVEWTFEWSD